MARAESGGHSHGGGITWLDLVVVLAVGVSLGILLAVLSAGPPAPAPEVELS